MPAMPRAEAQSAARCAPSCQRLRFATLAGRASQTRLPGLALLLPSSSCPARGAVPAGTNSDLAVIARAVDN